MNKTSTHLLLARSTFEKGKRVFIGANVSVSLFSFSLSQLRGGASQTNHPLSMGWLVTLQQKYYL